MEPPPSFALVSSVKDGDVYGEIMGISLAMLIFVA
jgi:hypothetical protein